MAIVKPFSPKLHSLLLITSFLLLKKSHLVGSIQEFWLHLGDSRGDRAERCWTDLPYRVAFDHQIGWHPMTISVAGVGWAPIVHPACHDMIFGHDHYILAITLLYNIVYHVDTCYYSSSRIGICSHCSWSYPMKSHCIIYRLTHEKPARAGGCSKELIAKAKELLSDYKHLGFLGWKAVEMRPFLTSP